ncbi:glutaredoxin family protein [Calidifontibacillus erzurumensis]|uniref:Glutaredoxin family protein n=1 Tax=Calidifontibacillus erzurumensis TaxID=2741433 RepID=A0A8J8GCG5_9BACI|nr:glutaredoxin domain-containing protein [Calidifontibacillus erzurumensis]NSL50984.1 glutaredoxin family protein [Calidifontibacillus erzurumensis]
MNSITIYTTTRCPYCVMLKNFLTNQNIPFKEVNVEKNPEIMQKLVQTTGQMGVPQSEVNGKWIVGYDPTAIMHALN